MTLPQTLKAAAVAVAVTTVSLVSTTAAQAFSFTITPGQTSTNPGAVAIDLSSDPFPSLTGGAVVIGSSDNQYKAPGTDSGSPIATSYLTVGGTVPAAPSPATLDFGSTLLKSFGLYWGSIDSYNTIEFITSSGVKAFGGTEIAAALGITDIASNYNVDAFVTFFAHDSSEYFSQVRFLSSQAAFEAGNFAYEVIPTPALLPGLIGLGIAALRRKQDETAEENA